jgi:hypothetical protein
MVVKRKIPSLRWESIPRTPIVQPVETHYKKSLFLYGWFRVLSQYSRDGSLQGAEIV